jgi:hypothetical protein
VAEERRLSKLTWLPLGLSVLSWLGAGGAFLGFLGLEEGRAVVPDEAFAPAVAVTAALATGSVAAGLAAMATGGAAFVRVQADAARVRGRGLASMGCLSAAVPLALILGPVLAALVILGTIFATPGPWLTPTLGP